MTGRRDFLRGLVTLPLIGGAVSLVGAPTAVAEPVNKWLMEAYRTWLFYEHRAVGWEMAGWPGDWPCLGDARLERIERHRMIEAYHDLRSPTADFHTWCDSDPQPSTRAALVLSTVGCDWRV